MEVKETREVSKDRSAGKKIGKRLIGLQDLDYPICVSLTDEGDRYLAELDQIICQDYSGWDSGSISRYLSGRTQMISVKFLKYAFREYPNLRGRLERIEENVCLVRTGKNGSEIEVDGLPIDLCSPQWGFIFGMLPDLGLKSVEGVFKDRSLANEVSTKFNQIGLNSNVSERGAVYGVSGKAICGRLVQKSGFIVVGKRQVQENICFPKWVYDANNNDFHKSLLAGLIESEGSAPTKSTRTCRITQAMELKNFEFPTESKIGNMPAGDEVRRVYFGDLNSDDQEVVKVSEPLLLSSIRMLLEQKGVSSQLTPESVYQTKTTTAALWNLCISGQDIRKLYNFCKEFLVSKDEQFEEYIEQKKEWHRDKGSRIESYLQDVKELYKKNGYVTSKMLAAHADRSEKTATNTLSILKNKGLIECEGHKQRYKCWKPAA